MDTLEGTIERIVFRNEQTNYTVARLRPDDAGRLFRDELTTLVGTMVGINTGAHVQACGEWESHPRHGRHFRVVSFTPQLPVTAKGIARYLGSGVIKGIGPKTAERIVDHFGEQTLAIIELEPERLTEVAGISTAKRDLILRGWADQQHIRKIMMFLQEYDVATSLAIRIYQQYGEEAIAVIRGNPYQLEQDIYGVGFKTADAIAVRLGLPHDSIHRLRTGLKYVLAAASEEGHCFLRKEELFSRGQQMLAVAPDFLPGALDALKAAKEVIVDGERVYLAPFFYSEMGTARRLRLLLTTPSAIPPARLSQWRALFASMERNEGMRLAESQQLAVQTAYQNKVCILTGGPGTGKTTSLRALICLLEAQRVDYCLAAPTGRAARRLSAAVGRPAQTLHRLLEFLPGSREFLRNEDHPLPYQFVVVDEASMLDLLLTYNLLKALRPEAHVLLVGDADQLPSVGPGAVLRDLLAGGHIPAIPLTELFRQARESRIVVNAHRIDAGQLPLPGIDPEGDFFFLRAEDPQKVQQLVLDLVGRRLPHRYGFDPIDEIQVLAPMYRGPAGVQALNALLQERLNREAREAITIGGRTFRNGDKVMQVRNNYDKGVFNGDSGRITAVDRERLEITVAFPQDAGVVSIGYAFHEVDELVLSYAISIHKAQGSEYPAVVLPLVTQHYLLLQRNLLYTAVTRARALCVIVGSPRALALAVANDRVTARNTALAERLAAMSDKLDKVDYFSPQ
jgi:exodeoxyribonuclease V alpha subunit